MWIGVNEYILCLFVGYMIIITYALTACKNIYNLNSGENIHF